MVNIWPLFNHIIGGHCALCHAPGDTLCAACVPTLPRNLHCCPHCAVPLADSVAPGTLCADCQARRPAFDRVVAPLLYRAPVDLLLGEFKYRHQLHLGRMLAEPLIASVVAGPWRPALLLPVPAAPGRLRERGFNQAAELARWLALELDIPWSSSHLARVADRGHQQGSRRGQRQHNVRGVFTCRAGIPAQVALIDDVVTTGATAGEAARQLKRAGATRVEVWAVARTPRR